MRRPVDADLNLTPYIDLLTCMVAFLLITAVWTQLARLPAQGGGTGDATEPGTKLVVLVDRDGFNLLVGTDRQILPRGGGGYDFAGLASSLTRVKARLPDKNDAVVASDDAIPFETLVGTMDALLGAGFPAVSLVEAEAGAR